MSGSQPTLTEQIIGAAMRVHKALGPGFLEKVYENALVHELRKLGFKVLQQHPIPVYYDGVIVGDYVSDIIVEDKVVIELKTARNLTDEHTSICINYLRCCNLPVCLLMNFAAPRLQFKRFVGQAYADETSPI